MIQPEYAAQHARLIASILNGSTELIEQEPHKPRVYSAMEDELGEFYETDSFNTVEEDETVSYIPLVGPIVKYDSFCEMGTASRAQQLLDADCNPQIKGHILYIDTPGGETLACELMVAAIKSCTKPTVAVVEGIDASAGLWISSACTRTFVSGQTSMVGCVGSMATIYDCTAALEKEGVKVHDIISNLSPDKNSEYYEAIKGNYEPMKKNILDPNAKVFIDSLKASRPQVKPEALTGKLYMAAEAIQMGLADEFGNINSAISFINMFNREYSKLSQFKGKQLSAAESKQVVEILQAAGIKIDLASVKLQKEPVQVTSTVYESLEEPGDQDIYVYAQEGEDPVGKRCVYADATGQPTETNVPDGDHSIADGSVMTTSTHDDGMSYVDALKPAANNPSSQENPGDPATGAPAAKGKTAAGAKTVTMTSEQIAATVKAQVDAQMAEFRKSMVAGKKPTPGMNGGASETDDNYIPGSKFKERRAEIAAKHKKRFAH